VIEQQHCFMPAARSIFHDYWAAKTHPSQETINTPLPFSQQLSKIPRSILPEHFLGY